MSDPVSEDAEYVVISRRGAAKLFLSQHGRLQDAGAVAVICVRALRGTHAVARWLSRIRRIVTARPPNIDGDAEVSSRPAAVQATEAPGAASGGPGPSPRAPGRGPAAIGAPRASDREPTRSESRERSREVA